jgi:hypothetical protein
MGRERQETDDEGGEEIHDVLLYDQNQPLLWRERVREAVFQGKKKKKKGGGGGASSAEGRTMTHEDGHAGGSGRTIEHTLVNGWPSSVMRSKREDVWCMLFAVTGYLMGGGWLGPVAM